MYAAAVFGNRVLAFCNLLLLAYLLNGKDFGIYTLMSTNALVLQLLLGSWASTSISKYVAISVGDERYEAVSNAVLGLLFLLVLYAVIVGTYAALPFAGIDPVHLGLTFAWSLALAVYEIVLAAENAQGKPKAYALLAMIRNFLGLLLSVTAAWSGLGVTTAAAGQVAGTLLPSLFLPSSLALWRLVTVRCASFARLWKQIAFGLGGMVAFGFYVLFSMTIRNIVGLSIGEEAAGRVSLATDLFYVPLALVVGVLFLSKMPRLYVLASTAEGHEERRDQLRTIAKGVLALVVPYILAGTLIADELVTVVLPGHVGRGIAPLAPAAALFGGGFTVLYATTMLLLIFDYRRWLLATAAGTIVVNTALLALVIESTTAADVLWVSGGVVLTAGLFVAWQLARREGAAPHLHFWLRLGLANAVMIPVVLLAVSAGRAAMSGLVQVAAVALGAAAYAFILWWSRAFSAGEIRSLRGVEPSVLPEQ